MTATVAYIGIGSNLDRPRERVRAAFEALDSQSGCRVSARSSLYLSAPVGVAAQADFVNAVCALETTLGARELLAVLLELETAAGRARDRRRGWPRTLDLDLLLFGDLRLDTPGLVLPHPRLHERAFVLYPLAEIAPDAMIPGRGVVSDLRAACRGQRIERLDVPARLLQTKAD